MSLFSCLAGLFTTPPRQLSVETAQQLPLPDFISQTVESAPTFAYDPSTAQRLVPIFQRHLGNGQTDLKWVIASLFQAAQANAGLDADRQRLHWIHTLVDVTMGQLATTTTSALGPSHVSQPPPSAMPNAPTGSYAAAVGAPTAKPSGGAYPMQAMASHPTATHRTETYFFPSEASFKAMTTALNRCQRTLDVCVFNITDDDLANVLISASRRNVQVRIIADDEQCESRGSDVMRLHRDHGIPIRLDNSPSFMHNKFALVDNHTVITGSYNWTKGARKSNRENILITDDPQAVTGYRQEFDRLWQAFS
ncbi:hypothetical protein H4R34_002601 [Dimargaris verticillata]|uniref:Mitochondrial cardiolipin hydrolase n=1 Tax=Dimargaris verticillata TaxID=2761393 RepID=A0A9W8B1I5_9FUNG|nr:hypothetical protein H4R34_002601 [Dimargaris verticillata]